MPDFKGQLGTLLDLQMGSILVSGRWSLSKAATGGEVSLVAQTAYVGDGCLFEFTILDEIGGKLEMLKAKSVANVCTARWTVSDKAKGTLVFLVEAPSLGLKGRSDALTVLERLRVGPVEAFDGKDAALAKATIGQKMRWKAKMPGVPAGTPAKWTVACHQDKAHVVTVASGTVEVANGEAVVDWETQYPMDQGNKDHQHALDKTSEKYEDASFVATFACLGVRDKSKPLPVKTEVTVKFTGATSKKNIKKPDGSQEKKTVTQGDVVVMEDLGIGSTVFETEKK